MYCVVLADLRDGGCLLDVGGIADKEKEVFSKYYLKIYYTNATQLEYELDNAQTI